MTAHLCEVFVAIRTNRLEEGFALRDACRVEIVCEITWHALDLYTLAHDMADEEELRLLVSQARATLLRELITRSESR